MDVVANDADSAGQIEATVRANPERGRFARVLLRSPQRSVTDGLVAESAVYSMLQAGPEFATRRAACIRDATVRQNVEPTVRVDRDGDVLHVTLARPEVHNALNTRMRDELYEALLLVAADPSVRVRLAGDGPSFCAGGDLDEFGALADPAKCPSDPPPPQHRASRGVDRRTGRGRAPRRMHGLGHRAVRVRGTRPIARPDTRIGLPEVGLGLISGAGGTVSLPWRIGRHRTTLLAAHRRDDRRGDRLQLGARRRGRPLSARQPARRGLRQLVTQHPSQQLAGLVVRQLGAELDDAAGVSVDRSRSRTQPCSSACVAVHPGREHDARPRPLRPTRRRARRRPRRRPRPGGPAARSSISPGERFSPPRTITSSSRPSRYRNPSSSR